MKPLLLSLLLLTGMSHAKHFSNPNEALTFISEQLQSPKGLQNNDVPKITEAIEVLYDLTKQIKLNNDSQGWVLASRARAIQMLNAKRQRDGNPIDHQQLTLALQDFQQLQGFAHHTAYNNAMYSAGHLAAHLLDNWQLAIDFWGLCADQNHAGCMNILASHYFDNTTAIAVDVAKSLYWHNQVYQTGTRYRCAGIYSAARIANLLFHFPQHKLDQNWQQWTQNSLKLLAQLRLDEPDLTCSDEGWMQLNFYTLYLINKEAIPESLSTAIAQHKNPDVTTVFKHLNNGELQQATDKVSALTDVGVRCEAAKDLLLIARKEQNHSVFQQMDDIIATEDAIGCHFVTSLRQQLQVNGSWSTML